MTRWGTSAARLALVLTIAVAGVGLVALQAAATPSADSFAGHCSLQGTTHFTPPITPKPGPAMLTTDAAGRCTGTLDGRTIQGAPVSMTWRAPVYADGCLAAHTTSAGPGALTIGSRTIAFTAGFSGALTEYVLTVHGQRSGAAQGLANLATTRTDPLAVAARCAGADGGLAQAPVDVTIATSSPLVNGAPAGGASFTGACQLSGSVAFQPALTTTPQQGRVYVATTGTCSGTLRAPDGSTRSLSSAPARVVGGSTGNESCELGSGSGTATLTVAGQQLAFGYREVRIGPALVLTASGADGGSALAEGNVSPSTDPTTILRACASSGLTGAPIDVRAVATGLG